MEDGEMTKTVPFFTLQWDGRMKAITSLCNASSREWGLVKDFQRGDGWSGPLRMDWIYLDWAEILAGGNSISNDRFQKIGVFPSGYYLRCGVVDGADWAKSRDSPAQFSVLVLEAPIISGQRETSWLIQLSQSCLQLWGNLCASNQWG